MDQTTVNTYNSGASSYAADYEKFAEENRKFIDQCMNLIKDREDPFILELGCANGRDAEHLKKFTKNYLGIDVSEELIKLARIRNPNLKFEVADIIDYQFPWSIDGIFSFATLIHLDKEGLEKTFTQIKSHLNPSGIFVASFIKGEGSFTRKDEKGERLYYRYNPEFIEQLAGPELETIHKEVTSPPTLEDQWFRIILRKK
jgi:SAM-dependent methyltransferase